MEKRGLELGVGFFLLIGFACLGYLSIELGDVDLFGRSNYEIHAKFASVAGLKEKAQVMEAGVTIGQVKRVRLDDGQAVVTLKIDKGVKIEEDAIASIKTMGIIGDKYISLSPGASDDYLKPGDFIRQTQPPLDLEYLLGKFVFGTIEKETGGKEEH